MMYLLTTLLISVSGFAQSASELESKLKVKPTDIRTRLILAQSLHDQAQYDRVIELLNPYTDSLTTSSFRILAYAYDRKKDHTNEIRVLSLIAEKDEKNFEWHMLLGQAYLKQASATKDEEAKAGLVTSAIRQFRRTIGLRPKFKLAYDNLLTILLEQKAGRSEARELLMESLQRFGTRPEFVRELCRLDAMDGFLAQAVSNCSESIRLSPNYPDHYVFLMQALFDQQEETKAERQALIAAKKFPRNEFVQWAAGTLYLHRKNYPVSARYFEAAVHAKSDSTRARFGLAQALYESGEVEKALPHFTEACKADASTRDAFFLAAGKLKQKGHALGSSYSAGANSCR